MSAPRRALLVGAVALAAGVPALAGDHPDAELVRLCRQHVSNLRAFLAAPSPATFEEEESNPCPFQAAWQHTTRLINEAEPRTMVGVLAKASAAMSEATVDGAHADGFSYTCHAWAWDLMQDLARIHGLEFEDPGTGEVLRGVIA